MEICRRAMWGVLRCEWEHLCRHEDKAAGEAAALGESTGGFGMEVEFEKMEVGEVGGAWIGGRSIEALKVPVMKDMSEGAVIMELAGLAVGFCVVSWVGATRGGGA